MHWAAKYRSTKRWDSLPWHLVSHRHICAIPHFATYGALDIVQCPIKSSTEESCDTIATTWWTFRIFFIFFSRRGRVKGESEAPGGGRVRFFLFFENPRRGGVPGGGGAKGPGGCLRRIGEFGGKIFFWGPKRPPRQISRDMRSIAAGPLRWQDGEKKILLHSRCPFHVHTPISFFKNNLTSARLHIYLGPASCISLYDVF